MTHLNSAKELVICDEPEQTCQQCGAVAECRPYGEGYTQVCFDCMMKDEEGCKRRMHDLYLRGPDSLH